MHLLLELVDILDLETSGVINKDGQVAATFTASHC